MPAPVRVILADDHRLFLEGLTELIGKMPGIQVVATAINGAEVMNHLRALTADVAVLDVHMPVAGGLVTTRLIREKYPRTGVLVLTMSDEPATIRAVLEAGAAGYVLKTAEKGEFEEAIRQVAAGQMYLGAEVTAGLAGSYRDDQLPPTRSNGVAEAEILSEREKEIATLVAKGLCSQEIAKNLFISTTTVDTHRRNLMQKLGLKNVAGVVRYALKQGWID
jgi:DNA-binding NarL/FixJ family response regulator